MTSKPTVGRIVHYVSYGTPGGEYTSQCRAAVVTALCPEDLGPDEGEPGPCVSLAVLNPTGMFFNEHVEYHDGASGPGRPDCPERDQHGTVHRYCGCGWTEPAYRGGTWHWPERVE